MERYMSTDPVRLLCTVLCGAFIWAFVDRLGQYVRLRHFKGPPTAGWSWWAHSKAVIEGRSWAWYANVSQKYGPIARIAPNHLLTSDAHLWARICAVRSPYKRAEWWYHATRFEPGKDNVFSECDNEKHDFRRKKMAAGYSGKENPTLEPTIDSHVKQLVHLIRTKYASRAEASQPVTPMDMATKMQYLTLDVVSDVGLGKAIGDLASDSDVLSYQESMATGLRLANISYGLGTSWLRNVPILGPAISPSENDETGYGKMMAEARKIIEERRAKHIDTNQKSDMIASFIRNGVAGEDLFQEVFESLLAGSDTTAAALRIAMLYLISSPGVYTKLRAEIDNAVAKSFAPASPAIISDAEARKLPYLCAVIRESMRVHPPVTILASRVAPPAGDVVTIAEQHYHIPGGTLIGYSAFGMHRDDCSLYGADAHVFRPERWFLDETVPGEKERLSRMQKVNDMIFGHGRWMCLGRNIALMELHKVVFEMVRGFDFAFVRPERPWVVRDTMGLWDIKDMWVVVRERDGRGGV